MADANMNTIYNENTIRMSEKQKVKEITDRLEEGLKELFEGEKYKSYLNIMSKFHNYSANNIQLISMQYPDATLVAGYKAWQRNFERHVKKDERGIRILAPAPYKIKEEREKIDSVSGEPMLDRDGMPVMEEVEVKIPAFRVVTVFDVAQTDGKEILDISVNELHGSVENYRDFMKALERISPVSIGYEEIEGEKKGYFLDRQRRIAIKKGMSEVQTAKTGVHEVAHAMLHAKELNQGVDLSEQKDRETKEVEAESIAYTVCQRFGMDTSEYSFGYIAGWSSGKELPELKSSLDAIRKTSSELITGIETQLLEMEKERAAEQANKPIAYGDVVVRISTPDSGEYEIIKITNMQSEVQNTLYDILMREADGGNENVLDYLQEKGFNFVPIMRSGGVNDGYPQFYDFDMNIAEKELHIASELPAMAQAEQLINRMEFHRTVYNSDERNLIMNHAYKLNDMYKTTSLAHSIAEQKDDLPMLLETIKAAEEEIAALPDGMAGLSQMHEYGYSWDEMLPLTKEKAMELFGDVSLYQLHVDGSETLVEDRAALQGHDGLFGVEKADWNAYKEYQSMKQELEDRELNREAQLLYGNEDRYGIYQLKKTEETRDIRFMDMDYLEKQKIPVSRENYILVYSGELKEGMSLEDIYTKFNIDRPADFTGHTLSVSDVVVLHQEGENTSHYVDSVGYREIPEFTKELSVSAEINAEKVPVLEETAEIQEEVAKENTAAEPDNDKVSYYVIEDLSTWAENSPEKSRLKRFDSFTEAIAKFTEYQGKEAEDKPDMARATFGCNVNGSEFDLIHVRNHENCLSLDFTHSRAAEESKRFKDDLQTLYQEVGFDKVRVHREMSPEEIKDFVKQRFEYQLKSSGFDDISLYMDRFDTFYEQGKMEHLMPTDSQKHIVEDVPFTEWENPYIDTSSHIMDRAETELAFRLADRYISIQEVSDGYDYTIYDMNYRELDGGVYDNPDITIMQALNEIVTDLKETMRRSELEGNIHTYDELIPIDYDELTEKVEQTSKNQIEEQIRKKTEENTIIAVFKAKTEEMLHDINGQTQEDIEQNVYAYLQSKIDEYAIDVEIVDVVVSGSRCRGLEKEDSDIDVVVGYRGKEREDDLFHAFHEDDFRIGGVKVDINPITEEKTGTLGTYLLGVDEYLEEKRIAMQEKNTEQEEKQTVVTLTVAECGEFHDLGEYHEGIADVEEAIAIFNRIPPERMNGIPSIGINIHTEGTEAYEDTPMDIVSGGVADLEILYYLPNITGNPKAVSMIAELIDKLPDIEVRGSLEKWQAGFLAAEIDQLSYYFDTCQYKDTVKDREAQIANITGDIRNGNTGYLSDFLNAVISDSVREGITDVFGKGTELDDSESVQNARKARELLGRLEEYKPLAKIEELEECNYNMIDNVLNNEKPKEEKEKQTGRVSIKEKLAEKKAVIKQKDRAEKEVTEKETEKKSEREI